MKHIKFKDLIPGKSYLFSSSGESHNARVVRAMTPEELEKAGYQGDAEGVVVKIGKQEHNFSHKIGNNPYGWSVYSYS